MILKNDPTLSKAYKEHHVFKELEEMKDFYEAVSDRAFCVVPLGTKACLNYVSYYYMSIQGTLDSINPNRSLEKFASILSQNRVKVTYYVSIKTL